MSESGFISFTNAEWAEMDAHADDLAEQIDALKPLAEAAVGYRQVLYGLLQRGALDTVALADLEPVDDKHGAALNAYINGDNNEGEDTDDRETRLPVDTADRPAHLHLQAR